MMKRSTRSGSLFGSAVFGLLLLLRLLWLNGYPFNSDEPQHAHVAWAWTQGLLPYRDVFDNHGPLFGWLESWPLRWIGEQPQVLSWLRLSILPWYFLALASIWIIGRRLYGTRAAWAALLLCAFYPRFFLISGQFRTDDMWMGLWLAALALVVGRPGMPRFRYWFMAGLVAGAALAVSQKTTMLLLTTLVAGLVAALPRPEFKLRQLSTALGGSLLGVCVPLLCFVAWFYRQGCLSAFWYGIVSYNLGGDDVGRGGQAWRVPLFMLSCLGGIAVAIWQLRRDEPGLAWRVFLGLQGWLFLLLILLVWPLLTGQDFLPVVPVLMVSLCGMLSQLRSLQARPRRFGWLVALGLVLEWGSLLRGAPPWRDTLTNQRQLLNEVLHYSDRNDTVMDAKGAAIFRRRPYYPVLESIAMELLRRHLMPDSIPYELRRNRTMMVVRSRLPQEADAFVARNYWLLKQRLYMAARALPAPDGQGLRGFVLELPGDYTLTDGKRTIQASLDGGPLTDHWSLSAGPHLLRTASAAPLALVWSRGWQRGWRPRIDHREAVL